MAASAVEQARNAVYADLARRRRLPARASGPEKSLAVRLAGRKDWTMDVRFGRWRADFVFRRLQLVLELDGFDHTRPGASARDAEKDRDLQAAGWTVVRIPLEVGWMQKVEDELLAREPRPRSRVRRRALWTAAQREAQRLDPMEDR